MQTIVKRIENYNRNRDNKFIELKYNALAESPYRFFRGTAHLFYEDFNKKSILLNSPHTWLCGDAHLENFGSYKSVNRLVYFDINDFDEAYIGPCIFDSVRLLVSIVISGKEFGFSNGKIKQLCSFFQDEYYKQINNGHASRIEHAISSGIIKKYLDNLKLRKRGDFIKKRTVITKGNIALLKDNKKYYSISPNDYKEIKKALKKWVKDNQLSTTFFKIKDIAFRIAGTGSLGLKHYAVLVEGKGYPQNYILDIKETINSSVQSHFPIKKNKFKIQSQRIVTAQQRMQDSSSAFLSSICIHKTYFVIKEHQPSEDRIDLLKLSKTKNDFTDYIINTAKLLAWAQLRSSGFMGSATVDEMIAFSKNNKIKKECINYAFQYSKKVLNDYKVYTACYKS